MIAPTLIWATNLADIEKHVLLARAPELDQPTSIVFDLDPGEPAGIIECAGVALHLRDAFRGLGIAVVRESVGLERACI